MLTKVADIASNHTYDGALATAAELASLPLGTSVQMPPSKEGYRQLQPGEVLARGDLYWEKDVCFTTNCPDQVVEASDPSVEPEDENYYYRKVS